MSYRNGDKSREHRLRKARQKKRENVRELLTKTDPKTQTATAAKK